MEDWERGYLHQRDVIEAICISNGFDVPVRPEKGKKGYGITQTPKGLFRQYHGKAFLAAMKKRGHSCMTFQNCTCQS